jgi:hypothetical protein
MDHYDSIKKWDDIHCSAHIEPYLNYIHNKIKDYFKDLPVTYIDIGANVGKAYDILLKNQSLNITHAYLFEPNYRLYKYIKHKYESNSYLTIFNYIISDKIELVYFDDSSIEYYLMTDTDYINFGLSHISTQSNNANRNTYKISDFIKYYNLLEQKIYIKIDTENNDIYILKDILSIIENLTYRPMIQFEVNWKDKNYGTSIINEFIDRFTYVCEINNSDGLLIPQNLL